MSITFYHNPACGTSRNALAIVRASGDVAEGAGDGADNGAGGAGGGLTVVEYLVDPPGRERLAALFAAAGITPREGLRVKGNEALLGDLGLAEADPTQDANATRDGDPVHDGQRVLDAMVAYPILINRPLVETPHGTVLARPSERVAEVLASPPDSYTKEDGETVVLGGG